MQVNTGSDADSIISLSDGLSVRVISDSLFLLDDDILLDNNQLKLLSNENRAPHTHGRSASIMLAYPSAYYWPDGTVPYVFNANFPSSYRTTALSAMNTISASVPVIFRPATSSDTDYIEFFYSSRNRSYIGRKGGPQLIELVNNQKGIMMHEILHSLGVFHEQSRVDRDSYITINWSNIRPDNEHNFSKYTDLYPSGSDLGSFDFSSIMLYSSYITDTSFVFDPTIPVMTKADGVTTFVGQRSYLSVGDINGLLSFYDIPPRNLTRTVNVIDEYDDWNSSYYEASEITNLCFYSDATYSTPITLTHEVRLYLLKTTISCGSNHQLIYNNELITVICPSGISSIQIDNRINKTYELYGEIYECDVVYYSLP